MELRKASLALFTLLLVFILLSGCTANTASDDFTADILKIGKADAMVVQCGGQCMLIDCGEDDDGAEVVAFLDDAGVETVDILVLTHFDKDHIGGAPELLSGKTVQQIFAPDYEGSGKAYEALDAALDAQDLSPEYLAESVSLSLGDAEICIMPSGYNAPEDAGTEIDNNMSLVTLVSYGEQRLLFAGDLEADGIRAWLTAGAAVDADLLKIPHHGRYDSGTEVLLDAVSPEIAVICCSDKNPPDPETLSALADRNIQVWETRTGNVHIHSNGTEFTVTQ